MAGHPGSHITGYIKKHGYFGPMKEVLSVFKSSAEEKNLVVLDVGANVGAVSLLPRNWAFPSFQWKLLKLT